MFSATRGFIGFLLAALSSIILSVVPIFPASAAPSSTYHYQFEGDTTPFVGNSTLSVLGSCPSTVAGFTPCNSSTSFGTLGGDGYFAWTSSSARGGGFKITTPTPIGSSYSMSLKFEFSQVSGYRKIVDYEDYVTDNGFYLLGGRINYYPLGTSTTVYAANTILNLLVTREAAPLAGQPNRGIFTVYVYSGSTLTQELQVVDTSGTSLAANSGAGSLFGFFFDDDATSAEATPSGRVYDLKLWSNAALSAAQVGSVATAPAIVTMPSTPTTPTATSGAVSATVSIAAPTTGGLPDSYLVTASPGGSTCTIITPDTSCVVTGLTAGTSYTFTAVATNGAGTSSASTSSVAVTPTAAAPAAPGAPGVPTASIGDGQATVTITAPNTGGAPASYTVTASPGGATCTVTVPSVSCVVSGLTNGTSYTFSATATNASGTSSASVASSSIIPVAMISAPPTVPKISQLSARQFSTAGGQQLSITGENLANVLSVTVSGKAVAIIRNSENELQIQIPNGTEGFATIVIRTGSAILTFTDAFRYVKPSANPNNPGLPNSNVGNKKITGFLAGSSVLTNSMKAELRLLAMKNKTAKNWICSGFSQGPTILPTDPQLALRRATESCAYLKQLLPSINVVSTIGKNYTDLGALYRRVEITWG